MKMHIAGLLLLGSLFLLSSCGQKGPLYLKKEPTAAPAAETKKDETVNKADTADSDAKVEKKD